MASGFSGQSFAFNSYLPIKNPQRTAAIRNFEQLALGGKDRVAQAQIFIETPYRNVALFEEFLRVLRPTTVLSVACDLTSSESEYISTATVAQWKRRGVVPSIHKRPTIFTIFAG